MHRDIGNRRRPRPWILAGVLLVSGALAAGAEDRTVQLAFALPVGKVLRYKVDMQQETDVRGVTFTVNESADVQMSRADSTRDGKPRVAVEFGKVEISMMRGGEIMPYEPDVKLDGQTLLVVLSPRGEVLDVEPRGIISGWDDNQKRSMTQLLQTFFVYFPDKPVGPDATWTQDLLRSAPGPEKGEPELKGTVEYTLEEIGKEAGVQVAKILGKRRAQVRSQTPRGTMSGESSGDLAARVAVAGGWVLESKQSVQMKGALRTPAGEERKVGQSIRFECKLQP